MIMKTMSSLWELMRMETRRFRVSEDGNVSIFTAFCLSTIIFFAALAIDLGMLTMEKDNLQNKVEAAAESGVRVLHSDGYQNAWAQSWNSLSVNGETDLHPIIFRNYFYRPGFYDYKGKYSGFGEYKNFASYLDGEVPAGEKLNAVAILDMQKNIDAIEIKPTGQSKGRVKVSAVAYSKNYTFLALGNASNAVRWYGWEPGYSQYDNCLIGSNGGVQFYGTETFDANTSIEAAGEVTTYNNSTPPAYTQAGNIKVPAVDWDRLKDTATVVYDPETWSSSWQTDSYGNHYRRVYQSSWSSATITYWFIPAGKNLDDGTGDGDHQGRIYFIDAPYPTPTGVSSITLQIMNTVHAPQHRSFWNATIAARCNMSTFPNPSYGPYYEIQFGDYENYGEDGLVYLYCQRFYRWYTRYSTLPVSIPKGVVIRCAEDFTMYSQYSLSYFGVPEEYWLKVVADSMYLYSPTWRRNAIVFHGGFGAPDVFKLGRLKANGD